MKKLLIFLLFCILVGGVYYGFVFYKDKAEKELKEEPKEITPNIDPTNPINTIDSSYYSICLNYIDSVNYQITLNQITSSEIPTLITDPNYTSTRLIPDEVNLEVNEKGIVDKGIVTYEHVVCNYENGKANLEKRTN